MIKNHFHAVGLAMLAATAVCVNASAALKSLPGHVPRALSHLTPTGRLAASTQVDLAIGLNLRSPAELESYLSDLYNPASTTYHQYLTPAEFTDRFGPASADYAAVIEFAQTNGLTVKAMHGNRLLLDVSGPAAVVEKAFHVTLRTYRHPTDGRVFFAPDTEPTLDTSLPVADVSGLETYSRPRPMLHRSTATLTTTPRLGSAPNGFSYFGQDFRSAYAPGTVLDGTGQTVGLVQFEAYYLADITNYATLAGGGRTNIVLQNVLIDGSTGLPKTNDALGVAEASLDVEMAMAMAPGLSQITVFVDTATTIPNDVLNVMVQSNTIKNLSSSWTWTGGPSATTENIIKQMAAQGQSFFQASGDNDALLPGYPEDPKVSTTPSSNPYLTSVGGTTLNTAGPAGDYISEAVWNVGFNATENAYEGSSGGVSVSYAIPAWQLGINSFLTNGGSPTRRNFPDVALTADNVYVFYNNTNGVFGGTSCATPLWAGFMALVNQQAAQQSLPPVGFANPALYELANESLYPAAFHDVTTGNSTWSSSTNAFFAVPGYDLCTGLGTPAGTNLINALLHPDPLVVISNCGLAAVSLAGAFPLTSQTFYLTNAGGAPLNWSVINTCSWLNVSASTGSLAVGASNNVTASLNSVASNLTAGVYTASLWFSNVTTGVGHARAFSLVVSGSLVQNGSFETGDFSDWNLYGNGIIGNYIANAVESPQGPDHFAVAHAGTYGAFLGDSPLAILAQTLPTVPGEKYLISFWLNNPVGGAPINGHLEQFQVNWNTNGSATNNLLNWQNPPAFTWTNLHLTATATGTNTIFQFGAQNQPNFFGLDDVNVTPIPSPVCSSIATTAGSLTLAWSSIPYVAYQLQYTTDLSQNNWVNLGSAVTAAAGAITLTDTNALQLSGQRFYRMSVTP